MPRPRVRAAQHRPGRIEVRVECDYESLPEVNAVLGEITLLEPLRRSVSRGLEYTTLRVVMRSPRTVDLTLPEERLVALKGVRRVDVRHLGVEESD